MNGGRFAFDVPVDHHAAPAEAHVPLSNEVLIPGTELFRVRGAGRSPFTRDVRMSDTKYRIDHSPNGIPPIVLW